MRRSFQQIRHATGPSFRRTCPHQLRISEATSCLAFAVLRLDPNRSLKHTLNARFSDELPALSPLELSQILALAELTHHSFVRLETLRHVLVKVP